MCDYYAIYTVHYVDFFNHYCTCLYTSGVLKHMQQLICIFIYIDAAVWCHSRVHNQCVKSVSSFKIWNKAENCWISHVSDYHCGNLVCHNSLLHVWCVYFSTYKWVHYVSLWWVHLNCILERRAELWSFCGKDIPFMFPLQYNGLPKLLNELMHKQMHKYA